MTSVILFETQPLFTITVTELGYISTTGYYFSPGE